MGRQLAFWRYEKGTYLDCKTVFDLACIEEKKVSGLLTLPLNDILEKVSEVFSDYDKHDLLNYENSKGSFTISGTEQAVLFDCSWNMEYDDLNRIIGIMQRFGCPFYDPQIETRFDGHQ